MTSIGATWQETGPSAFNYYGLTEQVSNTTTVYNDKVSQTRRFGRLSVVFIKVSPARLGEIVEIPGATDAIEKRRIGSFARIIMDAVYDYNRFGTLPKAYEWIAERKTDKAFIQSLVSSVIEYGNIACCRRIGWLLDRLGVDEKLIAPIKNNLNTSVYFIPANPTAPGKGRTNAVWNITENYQP
jgi:predicted transcriptional regulator of viral defense system